MKTIRPFETIQKIDDGWRFAVEPANKSVTSNWPDGLPEWAAATDNFIAQDCENAIWWTETCFSVNSAIYAAKYQCITIDCPFPSPLNISVWVDGKYAGESKIMLQEKRLFLPEEIRLKPKTDSLHRLTLRIKTDKVSLRKIPMRATLSGSNHAGIAGATISFSNDQKDIIIQMNYEPEFKTSEIIFISYFVSELTDTQRNICKGQLWTEENFSVKIDGLKNYSFENQIKYQLSITAVNSHGFKDTIIKQFSLFDISFDDRFFHVNSHKKYIRAILPEDCTCIDNVQNYFSNIKACDFNTIIFKTSYEAKLYLDDALANKLFAFIGLDDCITARTPDIERLQQVFSEFNTYPNVLGFYTEDTTKKEDFVLLWKLAGAMNSARNIILNKDTCSSKINYICSGGLKPQNTITLDSSSDINSTTYKDIENMKGGLTYKLFANEAKHETIIENFSDFIKAANTNAEIPITIVTSSKNSPTIFKELADNNQAKQPFFISPTYVSEEKLDIEYSIATSCLRGLSQSITVYLKPEGNKMPVWQTSLTTGPHNNYKDTFTLPGRLLDSGKFLLSAVSSTTKQKSEISLDILPHAGAAKEKALPLCADRLLPIGLGIGTENPRKDTIIAIITGNSILEYNSEELFNMLSTVHAGGVIIFLNVPADIGLIFNWHEKEFSQLAIREFKNNSNIINVTEYNNNLISRIPSPEKDFLPWQQLLPKYAIDSTIGKSHFDVTFDTDKIYSAFLELEYGLGKIILTTFDWLATLGRNCLAEAFLDKIIKYFEQSELPENANQEKIAPANEFSELQRSIIPWNVTGPFSIQRDESIPMPKDYQNIINTVLPPEEEPDYSQKYTGKNSKILRWRRYFTHNLNNFTLNLSSLKDNTDLSVIYVSTEIESPDTKKAELQIDSNFPLKIFINMSNTQELLSGLKGNVIIPLEKGKNHILLKLIIPSSAKIAPEIKLHLKT